MNLFILLSPYLSLGFISNIYNIFVYFLYGNTEPSFGVNLFIFGFFFLIFYTLFLAFVVKKIFGIKKINYGNKIKYFSWFYLFFPLGFIIYPIFLGLLKINLKKELTHIMIGILSFLTFVYIEYLGNSRQFIHEIQLLDFIPIFLFFLFIWNPKKNILEYFKFTTIFILIIILFTQPFYKKWFYNIKNSENQKICYSRPLEDKHRGPCFKIFKGYNINRVY